MKFGTLGGKVQKEEEKKMTPRYPLHNRKVGK